MKTQIGIVGVDAGLIMVGDPCYFLDAIGNTSVAQQAYPTWSDFCDDLPKDNSPKQLNFERGHEGLGIVVGTTHGDGTYPVYLETTKAGKRRLIVELG